MVADGGLIFDLNPGCTSFQHEPLRSMGYFPHKTGTGDFAIGGVNQILTTKIQAACEEHLPPHRCY